MSKIFTTYFTTCSCISIPDFKQGNTNWVLRASVTHTTKSFIYFSENCKTYRNLAKPVSISKRTPVRFSFSVKFIYNTFDNFNNIYFCFLLSGAAIESRPEKQWNKKYFATNQLYCIFKRFAWVLYLLYYIQKGVTSL